MKGQYIFIIIWGLLLQNGRAEGKGFQISTDDHENVEFPGHRFSIMIGHTHVPKGINAVNNKTSMIVPSWGLNYEFWINHKWAIGLHNDMEISTYVIDEGHGSEIERERPLVASLVAIFKPHHLIPIVGGIGREFEKHQNVWVFRLGVEFEIEMGSYWDLSPALVYDIKVSVYDSWTIGLTVGKRF